VPFSVWPAPLTPEMVAVKTTGSAQPPRAGGNRGEGHRGGLVNGLGDGCGGGVCAVRCRDGVDADGKSGGRENGLAGIEGHCPERGGYAVQVR